MKRRAAPQHQLPAQQRVVGYLDHGARQQQVLLNLVLVLPWVGDAPLDDVASPDQRSGSTSSFTKTSQASSSVPCLEAVGERNDGELESPAQ